jgi:hypothetical protein
MINIFIKYWIEAIMTLITSFLLLMIKQYIGLKNGMKALLKNEIIRVYETYVKHLKSLYISIY